MVKHKNYNHRELGIVSNSDVDRMKNTIQKPNRNQLEELKKVAEEEKSKKLAVAKAKKE